MISVNSFIAAIICNALCSPHKGIYKTYAAHTEFDWCRGLLAAICVVNVYDHFMSTGDFIADSIAIVRGLIKLSKLYVLFVTK